MTEKINTLYDMWITQTFTEVHGIYCLGCSYEHAHTMRLSRVEHMANGYTEVNDSNFINNSFSSTFEELLLRKQKCNSIAKLKVNVIIWQTLT